MNTKNKMMTPPPLDDCQNLPFGQIFGRELTSPKHRLGFTLAEVLITLAIIGVVAALTIPSVIKNYQKQQTVVKLKKAYTTLNQAINQSSIVNGNPSNWDYTLDNYEFFKKYIQPYLKVLFVCNPTHYKDTKCLKDYPKYLGGGIMTQNAIRYAVLLQDGTAFFVIKGATTSKNIFIDIDGKQGFNTLGKDIFSFWLINPNQYNSNYVNPLASGNVVKLNGQGKPILYPDGYGFSNNDLKTGGSNIRQCAKINNNGGHYCGAYIMKNGWKMPDDYPW